MLARRPRFSTGRATASGAAVSQPAATRRYAGPGGLAWDGGLKRLCADLAVLATAAAVIGLFALSPEMLDSFGFAYSTPGGGFAEKFHPSTFLALLALALRCAATERPLRTAWHLATRDAGVVVLLLAVGATAAFAILVSKTPVTGLVDTFILPPLVFLLLRHLDPAILRWIALAVLAVLCVNAVMAIVEFLGGFHVMKINVPEGASADPTRGDGTFDLQAQLALDWRATALLGHPLANGLIVGCLLVCLAAPASDWIPARTKLPLVFLQGVSMFAFGARTSLVLLLALSALLLAGQAVRGVTSGRKLEPRTLAWTVMVVALLAVAVGILFASGLADRTLDRFADDEGSAKARLTMFEMFPALSWSDLIMGPDPQQVATLQRINGLEFGIESSWIGLVMTYGMLVTSFLVVGLAAFSRSLLRACGPGAIAILIFYFVSVSGMAALSGKTTSLAVITALVMLMLPRDPRTARSVG